MASAASNLYSNRAYFEENVKVPNNRVLVKKRGICGANLLKVSRARGLKLSKHRQFSSDFRGTVYSTDIDSISERYLLCGCLNGSLVIYDLDSISQTPKTEIQIVGAVKRSSRHSHRVSIHTCQWFPHDTGLFVTSCYKALKIWDSNRLEPADSFNFPMDIYQHHWSPVPSAHSPLIAIANNTSNVNLIDVNSGSSVQELRGHKEGSVQCVQWSPRDANILCSGGDDGRILFWDVRSGKSYLKSLVSNLRKKSDRRKAHESRVFQVTFSDDGMDLASLSPGVGGQLKRWDVVKSEERWTKVCGGVLPWGTFDLACFGQNSLLYLPTRADIEIVDFQSGNHFRTLKGHFRAVNTCVFRKSYQELYSGALDKNLLIWVPEWDQNSSFSVESAGGQRVLENLVEDSWSDDD